MAKDRTIQPGFHNAITIMVTNVNTVQEVIAIGSVSHDNLIKYIEITVVLRPLSSQVTRNDFVFRDQDIPMAKQNPQCKEEHYNGLWLC